MAKKTLVPLRHGFAPLSHPSLRNHERRNNLNSAKTANSTQPYISPTPRMLPAAFCSGLHCTQYCVPPPICVTYLFLVCTSGAARGVRVEESGYYRTSRRMIIWHTYTLLDNEGLNLVTTACLWALHDNIFRLLFTAMICHFACIITNFHPEQHTEYFIGQAVRFLKPRLSPHVYIQSHISTLPKRTAEDTKSPSIIRTGRTCQVPGCGREIICYSVSSRGLRVFETGHIACAAQSILSKMSILSESVWCRE